MKNLHLEHVEDLLFTTGSALAPAVMLRSVANFINNQSVGVTISTKWDGAPAFVYGLHPETKRFFVGTKSVFAGKVNYTDDDIANNHPEYPELQMKLRHLLKYGPQLYLETVVQGDMIYAPWSKGHFDEANSWIITPNTLTYEIPYFSPFGQYISTTEMGIVVHTSYKGRTMATLEASLGGPTLLSTTHIYQYDPRVILSESLIHPREMETLSWKIGSIIERTLGVNYDLLKRLSEGKMHELVMQYVNQCIRTNTTVNSDGFRKFMDDKYFAAIENLKTENGKRRKTEELNQLQYFAGTDLDQIFKLWYLIQDVKHDLIFILNYHVMDGMAIRLPDNTPCGHEGYVVETLSGGMCKLVGRHQFSKANMLAAKEWKNV